MSQCAKCGAHGCRKGNLEHALPDCPCQEESLQADALSRYEEPENLRIARAAAQVEYEGHYQLTRVEEILLFLKKAGYHKIGLVFCAGLWSEASEFSRVLEHHGFEVHSVICKTGAVSKHVLDGDVDGECSQGVMCNPIAQAMSMNEEKTEFNILLGLCVGHDALALKYLEAPTTVLAVKDRVTGHAPLAPLYMANGYYRSKLYADQ